MRTRPEPAIGLRGYPFVLGVCVRSVMILTYPDRDGAEELAGTLRDLGVGAAAMPTDDAHLAGGMVWEVRVPEAQAGPVKALVEAVRNS